MMSAPEDAAVRHHDLMNPTNPPDTQWNEWGVPVDRRAELTLPRPPTSADLVPQADVLVNDGDRLNIPGREILTVLTPGHTGGSICLADAEHSVLITGDHLLPNMFAGLGLGAPTPNNPIADYLHSLDLIDRDDRTEVLPGHGYRFTGLADRCAASKAHHLTRNREVTEVIDADPGAPIWNIAAQLSWTVGWTRRLTGFYLHSALRQTSMHRDYAAARAADTHLKPAY